MYGGGNSCQIHGVGHQPPNSQNGGSSLPIHTVGAPAIKFMQWRHQPLNSHYGGGTAPAIQHSNPQWEHRPSNSDHGGNSPQIRAVGSSCLQITQRGLQPTNPHTGGTSPQIHNGAPALHITTLKSTVGAPALKSTPWG